METLVDLVVIDPVPGMSAGAPSDKASVLALPVATPPTSPAAIISTLKAATVSAPAKPREVFIQGITSKGDTFRPSDWAERLAGAMSSFRPGARGGIGAHLGYSPYCVPTSLEGVRCVVVNEALRKLEPMAWDFVMSFARDNDLQVIDACLLPEVPPSLPLPLP